MQLDLKFENPGNAFDFKYLSNPQNVLESNRLQISIFIFDLIFKIRRENLKCLKKLEDNIVLIDKITKSRYIITSHTLTLEKFCFVFSFRLVPEVEFKSVCSHVHAYNKCTL